MMFNSRCFAVVLSAIRTSAVAQPSRSKLARS